MDKENSSIGIVSAQHKERYEVISQNRHFFAEIKGSLLHKAQNIDDYPVVGDLVIINPISNELAIIEKILPRKSVLKLRHSDKTRNENKSEIKTIAANVDATFIVQAVDRDYNLNRFERFIVLAKGGNILPVIILNKTDLISQIEIDQKVSEIKKRFSDIDVISTTTINKQGLTELKKYIKKDKTYCFLGSSGVGKSTLINHLLEDEIIKTQEIGQLSHRGKHTTTHRELYFLKNGGKLIDNPGIREVGILDSNETIDNTFAEISRLSKNCKFHDCSHTNEPECAVLAAIRNNEISESEYQNYLKLRKESDFYEMTDLEKRTKDRKFGKFVKKVLKELDNTETE